jgi:uncharacterized protein (UPF0332 family)
MTGDAELPLGRGQEELRAAKTLLDAGFPAQAVAHAYLAGFHSASAALLVLGECPATSSGVISAFGKHVVGENGVDHETGRVLRRLYEDRNDIEHGLVEAAPKHAEEAVAEATRFVEATAGWIERRVRAQRARSGAGALGAQRGAKPGSPPAG